MGVVEQYSNEALFLLIKKMSERNDQVLDIVQLLMMSAEDGENNQKAILNGLSEIKQTTEEINSKMDINDSKTF